MKNSPRRRLVQGLVALAALAGSVAHGADFPARQVQFLVVFPAGGPGDVLARLLAPGLAEKWKTSVVVENRPGAGGSVAALATLREPADGHTLLFTSTTHIQALGLKMKLSYDPIADFAPVTQTALAPLILMVLPDGPRTLDELIARAKAGPMSFSSFGAASTGQIYGEVLNKIAGLSITNVPYAGGAPAVAALLGGHVQGSFVEATQALPLARAGKLRPLAVTGDLRYGPLPDVKTFRELGVAGIDLRGWHGVFARKGTPPAVLERIAADMRDVIRSPAVQKRMTELGIEPVGNTPQEWARIVQDEAQQWTALIERSGVKVQ